MAVTIETTAPVNDFERLKEVIDYISETPEDSWQQDVVRSADGTKNCFFGHLFNMGETEAESNHLWEWFEWRWATTYRIYPVNDGTHPDYQQETPKQRVLAYLNALYTGDEESTCESMEGQSKEREGSQDAR